MIMTIIYFILILGIIVCIHEFGHFLFAKKAGIYVYEIRNSKRKTNAK